MNKLVNSKAKFFKRMLNNFKKISLKSQKNSRNNKIIILKTQNYKLKILKNTMVIQRKISKQQQEKQFKFKRKFKRI